jgi:addiction module RelE/StbE family toxin
VKWADPAKHDLFEIADFIALDDLAAAKKVVALIDDKALSLQCSPERGRIVPELAKHGINSFRELVISPWRIIYKILDCVVYIEVVADGRRDLEDLLFRRIMR